MLIRIQATAHSVKSRLLSRSQSHAWCFQFFKYIHCTNNELDTVVTCSVLKYHCVVDMVICFYVHAYTPERSEHRCNSVYLTNYCAIVLLYFISCPISVPLSPFTYNEKYLFILSEKGYLYMWCAYVFEWLLLRLSATGIQMFIVFSKFTISGYKASYRCC